MTDKPWRWAAAWWPQYCLGEPPSKLQFVGQVGDFDVWHETEGDGDIIDVVAPVKHKGGNGFGNEYCTFEITDDRKIGRLRYKFDSPVAAATLDPYHMCLLYKLLVEHDVIRIE